LSRFNLKVTDKNRRPFAGKQARNLRAYALGRSGYQSGFPF
jgi:hypothetical protein